MAFGVKYITEFKDRKRSNWKTEILEDGYTGAITNLRNWGSNPVKIKFRASNVKLKHSPICPKDVEINVVADTDYVLMEFAYNTSKHFLMKVYQDNSLRFQGFILKGLGSERYISPPYEVRIRATDGLAELKNVQYTHIGGDNVVKGSEVLTHILNDLLGITQDFILDNSNLFPDSLSPGANDTSLDLTFVNQQLFVQEEINTFDVLSDLMTTHHCRFYQSNDFWVVEQLEGLSTGASQVSKKRNNTTYAYDSDFTNNTPVSIHADNKPIGSASISFIEAPKEIQVNTKTVKFNNILENEGLDNWGNRVKWVDINGGDMASSTDANGYAATNSFNTQTVQGFSVLGIGLGVTNSLYNLSASGKTHDITNVVDNGANKLTLTFTNEFTGVAPVWTIAGGTKLFIENRGVFEITIAATVGAAGVSTVQIRVQDTGSTPKTGDRIIGNINLLFALEQTLKIPSTQTVKDFERNSAFILQLEIEYASQFYDGTLFGITRDNGVHFIGIKAGPAGGDTFNGQAWENLATNGVNTEMTQVIGIPETEHEQFQTFKLDIPLDWDSSLTTFEEIHVALIGGYAKAVIYKSINYTITNVTDNKHTEPNVTDNNTSIVLSGTLFKAQTVGPNTEYGAMGGVLDVDGNEHIIFDIAKAKNEVIAELIKDGYDENLQIWKGVLDGYIGENHIIIDPKNFDRTFQIQEVTNNLNDSSSQIMCVEIRPEGVISPIFTITSDPAATLAFGSKQENQSINKLVEITNTGNIRFSVKSSTISTHFSADETFAIDPGNSVFFTVNSKADVLGSFNGMVSFEEVGALSNKIDIDCTVTIVVNTSTWEIITASPLVLPSHIQSQESTNTIVLRNLSASTITIEGVDGSHFTISPTLNVLLGFGNSGLITITSPSGAASGPLSETLTFRDQAIPADTNTIDVDVEILPDIFTIDTNKSVLTLPIHFDNVSSEDEILITNTGNVAFTVKGTSQTPGHFVIGANVLIGIGQTKAISLTSPALGAPLPIDTDQDFVETIEFEEVGSLSNIEEVIVQVQVRSSLSFTFAVFPISIVLPPHTTAGNSNETTTVFNVGSNDMTIQAVADAHFTIDGPFLVTAGNDVDFTITSTGGSIGTENHNIVFSDVGANAADQNLDASVIITSVAETFLIDSVNPIDGGTISDRLLPLVQSGIDVINTTAGAISVTTAIAGTDFSIAPATLNIPASSTLPFTITATNNMIIGDASEVITLDDGLGFVNSDFSQIMTIEGQADRDTTSDVTTSTNRVRVFLPVAGPWVDITGTTKLTFKDGDILQWNVVGTGGFSDDIRMNAKNFFTPFATIKTFQNTAIGFSHTMTLDLGALGAWTNRSIKLQTIIV